MCGIAGIVENKENHHLVQSMCQVMKHRGPDATHIVEYPPFTMGHNRLSIIDLMNGDQPIYNSNKRLLITFNGEVYNFRELKHDLIKKGHTFYTQTDTEVVLHLYEEYGVESFSMLNGMFAIVILDRLSNELILARDPFGIKPLHYYKDETKFLYASEIKSILEDSRIARVLNSKALHHQMNLRYNQTDESLFRNIYRLKPGHFLKINAELKMEIKRYYELDYQINPKLTFQDAQSELERLLKASIKRHLISDVDIGFYLSGGIDSGTLVSLAREVTNQTIKTFTFGFGEPTDEIDEAQLVAKRYGFEHQIMMVKANAMADLEKAIWHAEEPKINLLQGFNISSLIRQHVKVAISGLGGDELFAGYDIFHYLSKTKAFHQFPEWLKPLSAIVSSLSASVQMHLPLTKYEEGFRGLQFLANSFDIQKHYLISRNVWDMQKANFLRFYHPSFIQRISNAKVETEFAPLFKQRDSLSSLERILLVEMQSKMCNDYLLTEDRMSMANSIEQRVPFLDKECVEFAMTIPFYYKFKNGQNKVILRDLMKARLPQKIIQKPKWGFTFDASAEMKKSLGPFLKETLLTNEVKNDQIFNTDYIENILNQPVHKGLKWHYNLLWLMAGFYVWKKKFNVDL